MTGKTAGRAIVEQNQHLRTRPWGRLGTLGDKLENSLHRLFTRNQAITAMVLAEWLAAGYGDDDLLVIGWREELGQ